MVRTSVTHEAQPSVPHFCSYHILTSSVIYKCTGARQLGIYLLNRSQMETKRGKKNKRAHEAQPVVLLMFLPHFDVFCDLLLYRPTAT